MLPLLGIRHGLPVSQKTPACQQPRRLYGDDSCRRPDPRSRPLTYPLGDPEGGGAQAAR